MATTPPWMPPYVPAKPRKRKRIKERTMFGPDKKKLEAVWSAYDDRMRQVDEIVGPEKEPPTPSDRRVKVMRQFLSELREALDV